MRWLTAIGTHEPFLLIDGVRLKKVMLTCHISMTKHFNRVHEKLQVINRWRIYYICLMFSHILVVILTGFNWALINTLALCMVNMSNNVQKCLALIRKMSVNMSDVVKRFFWTLFQANIIKIFFRMYLNLPLFLLCIFISSWMW